MSNTEHEILRELLHSEKRGNWKGFQAEDIRMIDVNAIRRLRNKKEIKYNRTLDTYKLTQKGKKRILHYENYGE